MPMIPSEKPIPFFQTLQSLENGINTETGEVVCECKRAKGLFLFNNTTKQIKHLNCKAYICEYCGPKKVYKFKKALQAYLSQWKFIRMFTFTQHTPDALSPKLQNELLSKAWSHFLKEVRRDKELSEKQRKFQYVKVVEFTERGYLHYHVTIDKFMPILRIRRHWNNALFHIFGNLGGRGGINIKVVQNSKNVAAYLSNYMTKIGCRSFGKLRRWSKSGMVALFEKYISPDKWSFFYSDAYGVLNLKHKSTSTQGKDESINVLSPNILKRDKLLNEIYQIFFNLT